MLRRSVLCLALALFTCLTVGQAETDAVPLYELRIYTAAEGRMPALLARFRDHTCRLFAKHGMENIGYWVPIDPTKDGDKLYYFLRHASRAAAAKSWESFRADPGWIEARTASETNAGGKLTAAVESIFLLPTDYSPAFPTASKPGRLYELRTYVTPEGKLPALDARFRQHTMKLFEKHGMTNLPYFHPADAAAGAGNTLIYFVTHRDRDAAKAAWSGFGADPEWNRVRTESERDGRLTVPGGVKSVYLVPTDFSPLK